MCLIIYNVQEQGSKAGHIQSFEIIYSFSIYCKEIDIFLNNNFLFIL